MPAAASHVVWLEDVRRDDVGRVGGKNASLGEMVSALDARGVRVPPGFATTAQAYRNYLEANGLTRKHSRRTCRSCRRPCHAGRDRTETPHRHTAWKVAEGNRAGDRLCLRGTLPPRRPRGPRRGRPLERHRRGPAGRELCRTAGDLPQHQGRKRRSSTHAAAATPPSSPIAPSATGTPRASTT